MGILQRRGAAILAQERAARHAEEIARRMREIESFARDFLTTEQAATILNVSVGTLRRWRSAGTGPAGRRNPARGAIGGGGRVRSADTY